MTDIVPEIYENILDTFRNGIEKDEKIQRFLSKVEKGTAESEGVARYAQYLGEHAAEALKRSLKEETLPDGKLYWNIAERTILPLLQEVHKLVIDAAVTVTNMENERNGIGMKASRTKFPEERVRDLLNKLVNMSLSDEEHDE